MGDKPARNTQMSEEGNIIDQQINDIKHSHSLAGYTTSDMKQPTSSIMGATDNASNMEGLSNNRKKGS